MRSLLLTLAVASCGPRAPLTPGDTPAAPTPSAPSIIAEQTTPAVPVVAPIEDPECEKVTFPSAGASVLIIPGATMTRALKPVLHAACSCTRSGEQLRLTALITPEAGVVSAIAHDNDPANACIQHALVGRFAPPFGLGSDCIDCGPKRFPVFHERRPASPPEPVHSKITYPFTLVHR